MYIVHAYSVYKDRRLHWKWYAKPRYKVKSINKTSRRNEKCSCEFFLVAWRIKMHNRHRRGTQTSLKISRWLKYSLSVYKYTLISVSLPLRWRCVWGICARYMDSQNFHDGAWFFLYLRRYKTYLEKQTQALTHTQSHTYTYKLGPGKGFCRLSYRNVFMPFSQCSTFWNFCCC